MAARLDLSGISGSAEALRIAKFALQLDAKAGDTSVAGALSSPLAANLAAQTMELPRIAGEFDVAHPRMPMKTVKLAVSGRLKADLGKQTAAAEAATRFDDSRIQARLDVSKFSPLALGFDLDVDKLNVDRYLPPKQAPAGARKTEEPMDFSALKGLDAHGTVKIGALQFANVKAANVRLQTRAAGGRLEVAPHSATLYGGSLSGALSINANDNTLAARESLSNVSINPLMKDALDKDLIEGRGNVSLDVATAGNTMTAMKKALAGSARVNLHDGAVKGINLAKALREAKAALSMKQDTVQQASRSEKTDFSELAASFRIARGIAHNDDLMLKSPFLRVGGAGDINVAEGRMNYLAKASVVATAGGQGGKELEHLKGLTVPVRISGPFDNLSYRLELANLAQEAVRAKVEEKKQEVKEKAQEQIREGIKGLFKR